MPTEEVSKHLHGAEHLHEMGRDREDGQTFPHIKAALTLGAQRGLQAGAQSLVRSQRMVNDSAK